MSQENVELVRRFFEAFNSEEIERVLELTDPQIEVEIPPEVSAEPDTYIGHDGMRRYYWSFRDVMDEIRFEPERLWDVGPSVVVALMLTARGRQTAIPVVQRSAGVWTMSGGRVIRVRSYASPAEALEAVGLAE